MSRMETTADDQGLERSLLHYEAPQFTWVRGRRCSVVREPIDSVIDRWSRDRQEPEEPGAGEPPNGLANVSSYALRQNRVPEDASTVLSPAQVNRPPEVLVCEGEGENYDPLVDAPRAYLEFVAVGRRGPRIPANQRDREDKATTQEKWIEEFTAAWPDIQAAAVRFVEAYGLPRPGRLGFESYVGLPLFYLHEEAQVMAHVVDLLAATSRAEREGDYRALAMLSEGTGKETGSLSTEEVWLFLAKFNIVRQLRMHLKGVGLAPSVDWERLRRSRGEPVPIVPRYTCESLLSAMWLQAYFAATERRIVRGQCKGCGRPFEARDKRQEYCDKYCRHAKNQRDHYRRKKQPKRGGTI